MQNTRRLFETKQLAYSYYSGLIDRLWLIRKSGKVQTNKWWLDMVSRLGQPVTTDDGSVLVECVSPFSREQLTKDLNQSYKLSYMFTNGNSGNVLRSNLLDSHLVKFSLDECASILCCEIANLSRGPNQE